MLGRGLESLIPNRGVKEEIASPRPNVGARNDKLLSLRAEDEAISARNDRESVFQIEVDKIKSNPHQPRRVFDKEQLNELAASVREVGIIQPLIVSKIERETPTGTVVEYQLIAGERRLQAAKLVGLERAPVIIRQITQEKEKLEVAIIENIQRTDLNPIEAARSYAKLQEMFGLTQREVAVRIGKSRETVANVLRLLNLSGPIQEAIANKQISDSQGRLLLAVNDASQQNQLFEELIRNNLSVRELRQKVERMRRPERTKTGQLTAGGRDPELAAIEERLQEVLGTKVSLQKTTDGGRITISFFSPEEFREIVKKLIPEAGTDSRSSDSQFS